MSKFLKKHYVLALVIVVLVYKLFLKGWYMTATSYMYPPLTEPMVEQKVGRFSFTIPLSTAKKIYMDPLKIGTVSLEEIPYKKRESTYEEWLSFWGKIKKEEIERISSNKKIGADFILTGGFYEEDVSSLFGLPAHLLVYSHSTAEHGINVYINYPYYIIHLREEILIDDENEFNKKIWLQKKLSNLVMFFNNYNYGKENKSQETFFTLLGRVENIKNNLNEYVSITFIEEYPEQNYNLTLDFSTLIFDYTGKEISDDYDSPNGNELTDLLDINVNILRSGKRTIGKRYTGFERIICGKQGDDQLFSATWISHGPGRSADYPYMSIEMMCDPKIKERALAIWDTMLNSFQHV